MTLASGAKGPPNAFWHIRQWQTCGFCGVARTR